MPVAQGIKKVTVMALQTALGTPNVTSGQILRRKSSIFKADRDMFESDEIVSHHQSTGASYGLKKADGKLEGLLSAKTYQMPFEGILEADAVTIAPYAAGIDVTAAASSPQFVDASAGFLTAGLKVGMVGRWTGFAGGGATANNDRNFLITALTASNMTGVFLDGTAVVADAAGDTVTFTTTGQVVTPPLTGHLNNYYTFEEWYADITKSELFADCKVASISVGLPATGNATISFDVIGRSRTLASGAKAIATHVAETTTAVMTAINGFIYVNGTVAGNMTGAQIEISNGAASVGAVVGSNSTPDVSTGRIKVSGSFSGLFDATTFQAFYDAETNISLVLVLTADQTATSNFMSFALGRIKITGDAPDDGEKSILRTYPFIAELNSAGGASLAWPQAIIQVQDSAAT